MAGHSKWANIKHKKQREDAKKGKVFTKMTKAITIAAREGGGDPNTNIRLASEIERARAVNMPNENIQRAIKRGTGDLEGQEYEELTYEGYGPFGVAILLEIITDNRNRIASEIRHILSNRGGNLGENGCVSWIFEQKGIIIINAPDYDEDELMLEALEVGADDFKVLDDTYEIIVEPSVFNDVKKGLAEKGYKFEVGEIAMIPKTTVSVDPNDADKLLALIEELEDNDDVQNVYANYDIPDEAIKNFTE